MNQEPDARGAPLRRFRDPAYVPQAATLGDLRAQIDAIDAQLVALMVRRAALVKDATRFKRDAFQVSAPARQAAVFARVRALAEPHAAQFPPLPDVVEATWRAMVGAFVAGEHGYFEQTDPIDPAG